MPHAAAGLGRQRKLLNSAQFGVVFNNRKSTHGKFFSVHVVKNVFDHSRVGLAVSRRVSKKAVQRNRIKRQIRESFRLQQTELPPIDFVVTAKVGCAEQVSVVLRTELDKLWNRASKKCENC